MKTVDIEQEYTEENNTTTLTIGTDIFTWKKEVDVVTKTVNPIAETWAEKNYDEDDEKDAEQFSKDMEETKEMLKSLFGGDK